MGIESDFVTVYNTDSDYEIPDYIHMFTLGIDDRLPYVKILFRVIRGVHNVNAFICNQSYILITAHLLMSHILASLTLKSKVCLYVMHITQHLVDTNNSWLYRVVLRFFLKGKKVVTVSKGLEGELKNEYGISSNRLVTIYNPCDIAALKFREKLASPHTRPYILVMGRLEKQKNPILILELYHKGRFYKEYDLIYMGKGAKEKELREQIAVHHLEEAVHLVGFQRNPVQWISNAALLLSCSEQEGLPLNLIEALACGTPVVAADCPYGPNEILVDELARYLIDPVKKPQKSIFVISAALNSYTKITEKYYEKFDDELIVKTYLKTWRECFGREVGVS